MQDMHKLMNKDKIILRFTARMTPGSSVSHADAGRRFVLSYFMMDDSILIFEPPVRNSGISGGKFLERQRVYKPQSEEIYTYQVGIECTAPSKACTLLLWARVSAANLVSKGALSFSAVLCATPAISSAQLSVVDGSMFAAGLVCWWAFECVQPLL